MKIDVVRKLSESLDTVVLICAENQKHDDFDTVPDDILQYSLKYMNAENLDFKFNTFNVLHYFKNGSQIKILICGAGQISKLTPERFRQLTALIIRQGIALKSQSMNLFFGFTLPMTDGVLGHIFTEACLLTAYKFDRYLSDNKRVVPDNIHIVMENKNTRHFNKGIIEGRIVAEATIIARNLVNEPANIITPEALADQAKKAALEHGFSIDVHAVDKIRRMKMEALISVSKGSTNEPKLIVMRYIGNPEGKCETIGIIGKGLTFDSGGYCLKPAQGMLNMKNDMGGAAAVIGAMAAISDLKMKVNVIGVIAACENMISGEACRPGDIIRSMSGKTIEVINTDAEGRLTLIDAIHYALEKEHVHRVIDIATLTGAAVVALGTDISAVMTNNQQWFHQLQEASEICGENIWQLPAHEDYKELIKSEIADLKNVGNQWGGAITAGLFIQEFVQEKPWLHIDIAGMAIKEKENGYYAYGATGVGVRLLTTLLKQMED